MMHPKATTKDQAEASTWVIWDIKSCHFPAECDATRVGPCIRRALKNLDYNGPVTITAIGVLTKVPDDIMQSVSSTGVVLCHTPTTVGIRAAMLLMDQEHPPPANILLISAKNYSRLLCYLEKEQFNVLPQVFHDYSPIATAATSAQVESLWKSFLQAMLCPHIQWIQRRRSVVKLVNVTGFAKYVKLMNIWILLLVKALIISSTIS